MMTIRMSVVQSHLQGLVLVLIQPKKSGQVSAWRAFTRDPAAAAAGVGVNSFLYHSEVRKQLHMVQHSLHWRVSACGRSAGQFERHFLMTSSQFYFSFTFSGEVMIVYVYIATSVDISIYHVWATFTVRYLILKLEFDFHLFLLLFWWFILNAAAESAAAAAVVQ